MWKALGIPTGIPWTIPEGRTFSQYCTSTGAYLWQSTWHTDFMSCSETTEIICFGGSQIQMWTWMYLGPEVPDGFCGQEHHSELIPATRITASEWKYHTGQTEVWWI